MGQYLIDSNVISSYFSEHFGDIGMEFVADVIDNSPVISVITEIETLSWISTDLKKEEIIKDFIEDAKILSLTTEIVKQCIKLRRNKKIKTPDAIIAATAIVHNLELITSDKGFNNINGLKLIDPFTIR